VWGPTAEHILSIAEHPELTYTESLLAVSHRTCNVRCGANSAGNEPAAKRNALNGGTQPNDPTTKPDGKRSWFLDQASPHFHASEEICVRFKFFRSKRPRTIGFGPKPRSGQDPSQKFTGREKRLTGWGVAHLDQRTKIVNDPGGT
jgi:hypothetical protein